MEYNTENKPKVMKGFRMNPDLEPAIARAAGRVRQSGSWVINECLERFLPILEKELLSKGINHDTRKEGSFRP